MNHLLHRTARCGARAATVPAIAALLLAAVAPSATAQARGAIVGVVRDSTGTAVPSAEIRLAGARFSVRTDSAGAFRLGAVPAGVQHIEVRRIGFEPKTVTANVRPDGTTRLAVTLDVLIAELDPVTIQEETRRRQLLREFYDRKSRGFGHFITRDEIEASHPSMLSDMMRMVPGARLVSSNFGATQQLRFDRAIKPGRDCPPQYYVDGVKTIAMNIDDVPPGDVEGIEIYEGPSVIPSQYNSRDGTTICGVVLIWSRIPGT